MAKKSVVVVEQDPEKPIETKVLAQAIVDIGKAARALAASGLNQKAIVVLVSQDAKLPQYQVKLVLESLQYLAKTYTTR